MAGETLADLRESGVLTEAIRTGHVAVKEAVLPFTRFPDVDTVLGPEMRSTGEVMGIDQTFGLSFAKSQMAAGGRLPESGTVFFSVADRDKEVGLAAAQLLVDLGFDIVATAGTAAHLRENGLTVAKEVAKITDDGEVSDGVDAVEMLANGEIDLVVNTPRGRGPRADGSRIRMAATQANVPCLTTVAAAKAAAVGMHEWRNSALTVTSLQEFHARA